MRRDSATDARSPKNARSHSMQWCTRLNRQSIRRSGCSIQADDQRAKRLSLSSPHERHGSSSNKRNSMTTPQDKAGCLDATVCSPSYYAYRGIGFQRTTKGHWLFDGPPPTCEAWSRYATDEDLAAFNDHSTCTNEAIERIHGMIDRYLSGQMVYKGDLRYRN